MKFLRHISLTALLVLAAFSSITYFACTKDKCNDVACLNGGACDEGTCVCATGYEGNRCQLPSRDKIIGNYNGGDSCTKIGETRYAIRFLVVPGNSRQMVMKNILNDLDDSAICDMRTVDSFTFAGNNSAISYIGTGRYKQDSLWLSYHVQYDTSSYDCKFFGLKN